MWEKVQYMSERDITIITSIQKEINKEIPYILRVLKKKKKKWLNTFTNLNHCFRYVCEAILDQVKMIYIERFHIRFPSNRLVRKVLDCQRFFCLFWFQIREESTKIVTLGTASKMTGEKEIRSKRSVTIHPLWKSTTFLSLFRRLSPQQFQLG